MEKYVQCRSCKNKKGPKDKPGYYYVTVPYGKATIEAVVECECHKAYVKKELLLAAAREANIWSQAFTYDIDKEYKGEKSRGNVNRLKKYVNGFESNEKYRSAMLYLYGPNGTQKTTLAHWIGASILKKGFTVKYLLMQNLLTTLTSGFEDEEKMAKVKKLREVDLLIVDESFSKDKVTIYGSGYQLPFLDRFLRERFELDQKGIVFISNKAPDEIESQNFSKSTMDLVIRNTRPVKTDLSFLDNYMKENNNFDVKGLFD